MRLETWPARLVFAVGALVMIATSAPPRWRYSKALDTELESQGDGDDKRVRVHVLLTEGVAKRVGSIEVRLTGVVDRPASDLTILWGADKIDPATTGVFPQPFATSSDFLTVSSLSAFSPSCGEEVFCERVFTGVISTESVEAYAMQLHLEVTVPGGEGKGPTGEFDASVEVLDAP